MNDLKAKSWRCRVCGYVHREPDAPAFCPVCGSPREEFEPFADTAAPAVAPRARQWRCLNCNYVHTGDKPPAECPVCGAPADRFEPLAEQAASAGQAGAIRVVVVGAGIAGISAVESLRAAAPEARITVLSKEDALPYYRLNLTRYLADEIGAAELPIHPASWYEAQQVQLRLKAEVTAIDLDKQTVALRAGAHEPFDQLIVTAGAHPFMPPFPGAAREGVTALRTVNDAQRILDGIEPGIRCVCIGGGVLGLEAAGALARRGVDVTLLEGYGWLLPRQINRPAGAILERYVQRLGIRLRTMSKTVELVGDERVRGVALEDKTVLPAEMVIVTTGIRPNSYLARMASLEVNQGIIVDDRLHTSHPNIFAAGDVAEHRGVVYGIWPAAQYQGSIAGMNAAGAQADFGGIPRSNTLKVLGLDLFSIGKIEPDDASYEVFDLEREDRYFRFVFRDSHLQGAILLGDTSATAFVKKAVETRMDFSGLLKSHPGPVNVLDHMRQPLH